MHKLTSSAIIRPFRETCTYQRTYKNRDSSGTLSQEHISHFNKVSIYFVQCRGVLGNALWSFSSNPFIHITHAYGVDTYEGTFEGFGLAIC